MHGRSCNSWCSHETGDKGHEPGSATPSAALNTDGVVNSLDWSIMNAKWGTNDATADMNKDGVVNSLDFSIMNSNWGKTI
jgi:hypothetical protein